MKSITGGFSQLGDPQNGWFMIKSFKHVWFGGSQICRKPQMVEDMSEEIAFIMVEKKKLQLVEGVGTNQP